MAPLVLASGSPRRRELLARICPHFVVVPSDIEEHVPSGPPADAAVTLALAKARAVAARLPAAVVLGADTLVVADGEILGKPGRAAEAARMLRSLRNRAHQVVTGVAVVASGRDLTAAVATRVLMRDYSDSEIEEYVATGEPLDKAGAYAVQEGGGRFVAAVDGCYTNVVGLPVSTARRLLAAAGVTVLPAG
jgi:septum formation protein